MQTTKCICAVGLMAVLVVPALTSIARDTEAQIKAREALRQKMLKLEGSPAPSARPTAPPQAVVPTAAPAAIIPGPSQFAPVSNPNANAHASRAREAMRQQMGVLEGDPTGDTFTPIPPAVADASANRTREALRQQMAVLEGDPTGDTFARVPEADQEAKTSQAREALRRQMVVLQRSPIVGAKPAKQGRAAGYTAPFMSVPLVMEAPLPPLSGSKATRLAELLQRYNADQVTPKEYHTQRAAILAEP